MEDTASGTSSLSPLLQVFAKGVAGKLAKASDKEIIDLSHGKEKRGFDINGHHYWYRHPWASSDIIFLLRQDLPAHQCGLEPSNLERVWYLSHDYPERVRQAAEKELEGQW